MAISPLLSREYWLSGLWQVALLALAALLVQKLVEVWVASFAQPNHAYFPLPLAAVGEELSGWRRGLGVGFFFNEEAGPQALWTLVGVVGLYIVLKFFHVIFVMTPSMMFAGALANKAEALLHGHVFDWIVVPKAGHGIWAMSIGDVMLLAGMALLLYRLTFGLGKWFGRSVTRVNHFIRDPDLKWQLKAD